MNPENPANATGTATTNGRLWGARAQDWADVQEGQFRDAYDHVFSRLGLGADAAYCDVGCGAGMAAQMAAQRGARVAGLDAAENLLRVARERVPTADLHCGEMEALPFADARFDLVTGFNAFQFAANPVAALTQARRVTKPNGHVVVMTWGTPEGMQAASLVAALRGLGSSGVAARAMGHSGEEAVNGAHTAALAPFRQHGGGYRIGASFRWLLAGV